MFFERHVAHVIEFFVPGVTKPAAILDMVPLCNNYIKRLSITQLLPPIKKPQKELERVERDEVDKQEEEEPSLELESEAGNDEAYLDHFDFNILLHKLTNLQELDLVYQVRNCGMNFEWSLYEMTAGDCESLGRALRSCVTLKVNVTSDSVEPLCLLQFNICGFSCQLISILQPLKSQKPPLLAQSKLRNQTVFTFKATAVPLAATKMSHFCTLHFCHISLLLPVTSYCGQNENIYTVLCQMSHDIVQLTFACAISLGSACLSEPYQRQQLLQAGETFTEPPIPEDTGLLIQPNWGQRSQSHQPATYQERTGNTENV